MEDTIVELMKVMKDGLAENPSRENEPRFSGLFGHAGWFEETHCRCGQFLHACANVNLSYPHMLSMQGLRRAWGSVVSLGMS
jgi:hypothetical protein